jgi:hypothetical protein
MFSITYRRLKRWYCSILLQTKYSGVFGDN